MAIGYSFMPGADLTENRGGTATGGRTPSAPAANVEVRNFRLPSREAARTIAPVPLLQSQGAASAPAGFDPMFINLLAQAFKMPEHGFNSDFLGHAPQAQFQPQEEDRGPSRPQGPPPQLPPLSFDAPEVQDFLSRNKGDVDRAGQALGRTILPRIIVNPEPGAGGLFER